MFITFEGIDGAGKTTQVRQVEAWLQEEGIPYLSLREPGGTQVGEEIRRLLKDAIYGPLETETEIFLLSASRTQILVQEVLPALEEGTWVILDRYTDSTLAYQAYGRGFDLEEVRLLNHMATRGLKPNVTFYLDLDPGLAQARQADRRGDQQVDRMESSGLAFMERVREGYLALAEAEPDRFVTLDGSQPATALTAEILANLKEWKK